MTIVRIGAAALLWIHGLYRLYVGGSADFGAWLETQHIPAFVAWMITIFECISPPLLMARRFVRPLVAVHMLILIGGIVMVHAPEGWWVVGAGRNGMEYSVLLLICLAAMFRER